MLADLIKIEEGVLQPLYNSGHATQPRSLELLALKQRLPILEKTDVISRDCLNQMLGRGHLAKGDFEMIGIIERVEQIFVERMDIL